MTSPLVDLVAAYLVRAKTQLAPDWAANAPAMLELDDSQSLARLVESLGWHCQRHTARPKAHHFPFLAFHPSYGWGIAEQWFSDAGIRYLNQTGTHELLWDGDLSLFSVSVPTVRVTKRGGVAISVFWSAIMRRKSMIVDATIATVLINLLGLATSLYSMQVYDRVIPHSGFATLIVLTAGMIFAQLIDTLIRTTRAMMLDREANAIDGEVSEFFYGRMQAVRLDARPKGIGTMAAQLRGLEQVRALMSSASLFVLADLPFAVLFTVVMAMLGGVVAIVPFIAFPVSILFALLLARLIRSDTDASQVSGNRKNGLLVEALDAAETIKANQGGWHMLAAWNRLVEEVHVHDLKVKRWSTLSSSIFGFIQNIAYVAIVCIGAFEVSTGQMTMGAVIACSILSGRINGPLVASLPSLIIQWGYARSSLTALDAILEMPSDQPHDREPVRHLAARGALKAERIKFTYAEARNGVLIEKMEFKPGERVGMIGAIGSGKSTILKLLSGMYASQEGYVLLDGVDLSHMAEEDLRRHICYFPQEYRLINGTLRDNLTLGVTNPTDETLIDAAEKTGLLQLITQHPMGFDLPISEGGRGLSGGQRALVGLTRLMLVKPKVLLLDEPTANLDQDAEARVLKVLFDALDPQTTVVLVTHKIQLLGLVQRLMLIANGRPAVDGPTQAVINHLTVKPASSAPAAVPATAGAL